jgi:hypothetical protein
VPSPFKHPGNLHVRARATCATSGDLRERCRETRSVSMELRIRVQARQATRRRLFEGPQIARG